MPYYDLRLRGREMTVYGIWRCSTDLQDQERQVLALKEAGAEKIYGDKITGTSDFHSRPELSKCLEEMKSGDLLIISELSRLSRSFLGMVNEVSNWFLGHDSEASDTNKKTRFAC